MVLFTCTRRFSSSVQENLRRGEGDLSDLVSINIQRGRERGLPGYTKYRNLKLCGLSNVKSFDDLKNVASFAEKDVENLRKVYDNVHDIDLFVGGKQYPSACLCVCDGKLWGRGGGGTVAPVFVEKFREHPLIHGYQRSLTAWKYMIGKRETSRASYWDQSPALYVSMRAVLPTRRLSVLYMTS